MFFTLKSQSVTDLGLSTLVLAAMILVLPLAEIDQCARCGGQLKILASIEDPAVIAKILAHLQRTVPEQYRPALPLGARQGGIGVRAGASAVGGACGRPGLPGESGQRQVRAHHQASYANTVRPGQVV